MRVIGPLALLATLSLAAPLHATCKLGVMADFPIHMEGRKAVTTLKINGEETPFAIDTGAFYSIITPGYASQFKLPLSPVPIWFTMRGVGGAVTPQIAKVKALGIVGATLPNVSFLVDDNELGGHTGVVGENILAIGDGEYDLAHSTVKLVKPFGCEKRPLAYWAKPDQSYAEIRMEPPLGPFGHYPVGKVSINGVPMRAIFDTGADTSILDIAAAKRAGVPLTGEGVTPGGLEGGIGRKRTPTVIAPIQEVSFGPDETIKNTRIKVGAVGDGYDMLIGADFFLSHHVYIANSQEKIFFTYGGGPVFNLQGAPKIDTAKAAEPSEAEPTDAPALAKMAAVRSARQDYAGAKALLDKAVALAPDTAEYRRQRAETLIALRMREEAMADLDKAVSAQPEDVHTRLDRAALRHAKKDDAKAREDLLAADHAMAAQADERLSAALLYEAADQPTAAIADLDAWIKYHPEDNRRVAALNSRCWVRVRANLELEKALADCNAAHRAAPKSAAILDSRGWLFLRRGEPDAAKTEFDAALALQPKQVMSLLGRSIAEAKLHDTAAAKADRAAAAAIRAEIADDEKRLGFGDLDPS